MLSPRKSRKKSSTHRPSRPMIRSLVQPAPAPKGLGPTSLRTHEEVDDDAQVDENLSPSQLEELAKDPVRMEAYALQVNRQQLQRSFRGERIKGYDQHYWQRCPQCQEWVDEVALISACPKCCPRCRGQPDGYGWKCRRCQMEEATIRHE